MNTKRKKPTKAEAKAKKQTKATPAKAKKPQAVSFDALVEEAAGRKIVLHIGCGQYKKEKLHKNFQDDSKWFELRLDIDPNVKPHIISDMVKMDAVPDESVDVIWSSHNVEHLYPHIVPDAMKEFYRVLKPEGHVLITLPDLQTVATHVAHGKLEDPIYDSPAGPISAIDIMYGLRSAMKRGNLFMAHKTGFTARTLGTHFRDAGFSNIKVSRDWIDLWGIAYKFPQGHPKRNEKIAIHENSKKRMTPPELPELSKQKHPGHIDGHLPDELDIPPRVWEPLNLNKKSG